MSEPFTIHDIQSAWDRQKKHIAQRRQDRDARLHAAIRRDVWKMMRYAAEEGIYYQKASRFSDGHDYLPLDLWDQTKDE